MKHRHIDTPEDEYSIAAIHSIMERGGASDMRALLRAIQADPFSEVAERALKAAEDSDVYGYPEVIRLAVERWRAQSSQRNRLG